MLQQYVTFYLEEIYTETKTHVHMMYFDELDEFTPSHSLLQSHLFTLAFRDLPSFVMLQQYVTFYLEEIHTPWLFTADAAITN